MKANNIKHQRHQAEFQTALASIVAQIRSTEPYQPTVTEVRLSRDSSHLKVLVAFANNPDIALEKLRLATGFVRTELAHHSNQRTVPQIHFEIDDSFAAGSRIDAILDKLASEKGK